MAATAWQRLIGDFVAPMDASMSVHSPGFVDIADGRILASGPLAAAPEPPSGGGVDNVGGLLMPGMINGHAHSSMTLLRGSGEGLPLDRWLKEVIWPRESRLSPDDVEVGMMVGAVEMLRNGVTTSNEMYFFPEAVAAGAARVGMRAIVGVTIIEGLERFGTPEEQFEAGLVLRDQMKDPLIEIAFGPHSAYTLREETLRRIRDEALARDMLVHIHVAETRTEGDGVTRRTGRTVPEYLADLGMLECRMVAAHGVWLTDSDMALFGAHDVGVAHCPGSNGKLASGIAPVRAMREAGISVAVSTDGPASNDNLDVLDEARLALLYARLRDSDPSALGVGDALRMITSEAARAVGRPDLGSLEAAKAADIVRVSLDRPEFEPIEQPADVLDLLVWAGSSRDVTDVWVGGDRVVEAGEVTTIAVDELRHDARRIAARIAG
ncbi:MAG: amidohydrolase [Acidimicrobiia bacterium]|nr:amidohydrolase [Acidimicrobiia bacterium]